MSLTTVTPAALVDELCLDAITYALNAPTLDLVRALEDRMGDDVLLHARSFGAVAAITIGRARQSALRVREQELVDLIFARRVHS